MTKLTPSERSRMELKPKANHELYEDDRHINAAPELTI